MKKGILALVVLGSWANPGYSQFKSLLNKVRTKIDQKVDNGVDKTLNRLSGDPEPKIADTTHQKNGPSGQTEQSSESPLTTYSKYDFVPGDRILYAEDFSQEALGELPVGWNSSGTGEVVQLDKFPGRWLRLHKPVAYLTANQKKFGRDFTIEFDMILQLKNNGWLYPSFSFGMLSSRDKTPGDNDLLKEYQQYASVTATLYPAENNASRAAVATTLENKSHFKGVPVSIGQLQNWYGRPVHIAIQVQKERLRLWTNEYKAFDVPKAVPLADTMNQLRFEVGQTNYPEEGYGVYISNIKIGTGLPDTRHKLITEGNFTTNGILFDPQSAVVRPESFGVIKEVAAVLQDNPSVRIRITGHTSSDGNETANLELSRKRAAAVKDLLVREGKIEANRIDTDGKGQTVPIADNKTREGRAQNRRVEFQKL